MPGRPKYHGLNSPKLEKLRELLTILNQCCNIETNSNEYIN